MTDYRCVNGHDRCDQMYPGSNCPYCERIVRKRKKAPAASMLLIREGFPKGGNATAHVPESSIKLS
jgi:DNA-directed RNA polymerase subunit RPC12/RpoP